jgi:hypothetical protein
MHGWPPRLPGSTGGRREEPRRMRAGRDEATRGLAFTEIKN